MCWAKFFLNRSNPIWSALRKVSMKRFGFLMIITIITDQGPWRNIVEDEKGSNINDRSGDWCEICLHCGPAGILSSVSFCIKNQNQPPLSMWPWFHQSSFWAPWSMMIVMIGHDTISAMTASYSAVPIWDTESPTHLDKDSKTNSNRTLSVSLRLTTIFWQFARKVKFLAIFVKFLTWSCLHRCRRGGGGVAIFLHLPPNQAGAKTLPRIQRPRWDRLQRCGGARCRISDCESWRAHTMAWPRCYTCSQLVTPFEELSWGDLN